MIQHYFKTCEYAALMLHNLIKTWPRHCMILAGVLQQCIKVSSSDNLFTTQKIHVWHRTVLQTHCTDETLFYINVVSSPLKLWISPTCTPLNPFGAKYHSHYLAISTQHLSSKWTIEVHPYWGCGSYWSQKNPMREMSKKNFIVLGSSVFFLMTIYILQ